MLFPFQGLTPDQERLNEQIKEGAAQFLTDIRVLENEIKKFKKSDTYKWSIIGENYYLGQQDILEKQRTMIDENGGKRLVNFLPNNRSVDNQYGKLVDSKVNYQLGKPITLESDNEAYTDILKTFFDKTFTKQLRQTGYNVFNGGIAWIHPYISDGTIKFRTFKAHEIIPFWADSEREVVYAAVRLYTEYAYEGDKEVAIEKVDVFTVNGVITYKYFNNQLVEDVESVPQAYINVINDEVVQYLNWDIVPMIPVRFNGYDQSLIKRVKTLQDALNDMTNELFDKLQESGHNTILILENYDGQSLGEFRKNLATFGAIKVRSGDGRGGKGDVRTLEVKVNAENFTKVKEELKSAIIENGRGYDLSRLSGSPTQIEIRSVYSDIEMDANGFEIELQSSFDWILWFIDVFLKNTGKGDFVNTDINVIFNRDTMVNEKEVSDILKDATYLSTRTKIAQHPFVEDVERELEYLKEQEENDPLNQNYNQMFNQPNSGEEVDEE